MRAVFLSNFFNHHQKGISDELYALTGGDYMFVATGHMDEERIRLGWSLELPPYVRCMDPEKPDREVMDFIDSADFAVIGSAPYGLVSGRLRHGKLTFLYGERIYKIEPEWYRVLWHRYKYGRYFRWRKNAFLLCSSAYTAGDFARLGLFRGKSFKWGYFPALKSYPDVETIVDSKKAGSILWVGRLIDWKHPELPVELARRLKNDGYDFSMKIVGTGYMEAEIRAAVAEAGLSDHVSLLGSLPHEEVRPHMEESSVFIFTSNRREGWGAVVNEAMNSACAVVACRAAGSVPFMIRDGVDGMVYEDGDFEALYLCVRRLLEDRELRKSLSMNAYRAVSGTWSPTIAADRLCALATGMISGENPIYANGPCSPAEIVASR